MFEAKERANNEIIARVKRTLQRQNFHALWEQLHNPTGKVSVKENGHGEESTPADIEIRTGNLARRVFW